MQGHKASKDWLDTLLLSIQIHCTKCVFCLLSCAGLRPFIMIDKCVPGRKQKPFHLDSGDLIFGVRQASEPQKGVPV
jgi:hypothetical protein